MKQKTTLALFIFVIVFAACSKPERSNRTNIIIGISSDIQSLSPLYSFVFDEGTISELLFLSLVQHDWDEAEGTVKTEAMLAKNWQWEKDGSSLKIYLREDAFWSDGIPCTAEDVVFSFDVYSDPVVQSRAYGSFEKFNTDSDGRIIIGETFEVLNPYELIIKFKNNSNATLFDIDYSILPKHILEKVPREEFKRDKFNHEPVTNGAFRLERWEKELGIILAANPKSILYREGMIEQIIFKIIPDYNNRILQLLNNEIDLIEEVKPEDVGKIRDKEFLRLGFVKGREYDYIGWNNIDGLVYNRNGVRQPHNLFGDRSVRQALSMALNRSEILDNYLLGFGEIGLGPVPGIFKQEYNTDLIRFDYDLEAARKLLNDAGWKDSNGDGYIDKDGIEFKFDLQVPVGNPRRKYAAEIFYSDLKKIGIEMRVNFIDMGLFIDGLFEKKYDAWMVGWVTQVPINLAVQWRSDLENTPFNFISYKNEKVDSLLSLLEMNIDKHQENEILKKIQYHTNIDQPVTFLYWLDNVVAYHSRLQGLKFSPLGVVIKCWQWRIN